MFAQTYQSGLISLLYSVGNKPLQLWEKCEEEAARSVARVLDDDVQSAVIELSARESVANTWIRCPAGAGDGDSGDAGEDASAMASLHIRLRHLVLLVKPLEERELSLEVAVRDTRGQLRRFRASSFQRATAVHARIVVLPLRLDAGSWNQLQLDLAQLTREAYGTAFDYAVSVQLHANCRVRRVYFAERVVAEEQLPAEFRLFKRLTKAQAAAYKALDKSEEAAAAE
ncbi:hypothetical protein PybrP1_006827 [[Pythium] brassicae (nom. inval.)]|nr:hypothetical protein PybrP1_006827 [[Pythium] brassicae (nom. inval.)]